MAAAAPPETAARNSRREIIVDKVRRKIKTAGQQKSQPTV
jgi:hypothetical protein